MRALVVLLAACVAATYASSPDISSEEFAREWEQFKEKHGKTYKTDVEETFRKKIYHENKRMIDSHNQLYKKGQVTFSMAMNKFGDLLNHERVKMTNGFKSSKSRRSSLRSTSTVRKTATVTATVNATSNSSLPSSVDWRKEGYVTGVKDQGQCGSCWAFSTTGALEGALYKKTGKLVSLSEQNLVDCNGSNDGCDGGFMELAFDYIRDNGGIDTEESYPYEGVDWNGCRYTERHSAGTDTGYVAVAVGNETDLQVAVAYVGPVSIAIDAALNSFSYYSSGIYYDKECKSDFDDLDHGVLAVGYGTDNTTGHEYWLVKNSWGTEWGEEGYIKMARNKDNNCGVASEADFPTV